MMVLPLLVLLAGGDLGLMPDPTVVEELELLVVDSSSGGQGPSPAADMEGEKESEPEWEQFVLSDGLAPVPAKLVARIFKRRFC